MSILTWRDVASPDFGTSMQGRAVANNAMNDAFASLQSSLQGARDYRATEADRAIQQRLLAYQDPDALKSALADGSIVGPDGRYAHMATLTGLNDQVANILKNSLTQAQTGNLDATTANTRQNTTKDAYNLQMAQQSDARFKAAQPTLAALQVASKGDPQVYQDSVNQAIKNGALDLRPDEAQTVINHGANNAITNLNWAGTAHGLGQTVLTDAQKNNANTKLGQILGKANNTAEAVRMMDDANLSGYERDVVSNGLASKFPDIHTYGSTNGLDLNPNIFGTGAGPVGGPVPIGYGAKASPSLSNNFAFSNTDKLGVAGPDGGLADGKRTIGDAQAWADTNLKPASKKLMPSKDNQGNSLSGLGTTAHGMYMMTNGTYDEAGKAVFGDNYTNLPQSAMNDDLLAQWKFSQLKSGKELGQTWQGLSGKYTPAQLDQLQKLPWDQVAPIIISTEHPGLTPESAAQARENSIRVDAAVTAQNKHLGVDLATQGGLGQIMGNPLTRDYVDSALSLDKKEDVVQKLMQDPRLKNANTNVLNGLLQKVYENGKGNLNWGRAGLAVLNGLDDSQGGFGVNDFFNRHFGNGNATSDYNTSPLTKEGNVIINSKKLEDAVNTLTSREGAEKGLGAATIANQFGGYQTVLKKYQDAVTALNTLTYQDSQEPGTKDKPGRYGQQLEQARQNVMALSMQMAQAQDALLKNGPTMQFAPPPATGSGSSIVPTNIDLNNVGKTVQGAAHNTMTTLHIPDVTQILLDSLNKGKEDSAKKKTGRGPA